MTAPTRPQAVVGAELDAQRRARFPLGAALTLDDLSLAGREPVLDVLREHEPVSWVPALGGWLVTSRSAARVVLSPRTQATVEIDENLVRASLGPMMLTTDGDEHARLRGPFERPFKLGTVRERFGAAIVEEAMGLIDAIAPLGSAEIGARFAAPFAVGMAGRMLGLSLGDTERIDRIYAALAGGMVYDGDPEPGRRANVARAELDVILHGELERRRQRRDDSITAQVLDDPEGLTDDEIVAQLRVIMFGAIETIQASLMNTLLLLFRHPDQLDAVRGDDALLGGAVDEAIRLIPPVAFVERWTAEPLAVAGVEIPVGEFVGVSVVAANRDPESFPSPLAFDITRANAARSLAFAFGIHACLGVHLAKVETAEALRIMLDRLTGLRMVEGDEPAGFAFRRPSTLTVEWDR